MKYASSITQVFFLFLIFSGAIPTYAVSTNSVSAPAQQDLSPWMKPRTLSSFQSLMQHSPFSLATAEESSPLSERYILTGIVSIDGEDEAFVFDKNDQSHEVLTKKPNAKSMALIGIPHNTDPNKLKATIRANGEIGVISSVDTATNNPRSNPHRFVSPGASYMPNNGNRMMHPPTMSQYPGQNPASHYQGQGQNSGAMPPNMNNRRVIRRPVISGPLMNNTSQPNNF